MSVVALPTRPHLPAVTLYAGTLPAGRWHERAWVSDRPVTEPDLYRECVADFERSRLWPVLVPDHEPWARSAERDPGEVRWARSARGVRVVDFSDTRTRHRGDGPAEAGNLGWVRAALGGHRLALVPVSRPAEAPEILGWDRAGALAALLSSWENRFDATLVTLGSDVLELAVAAPPRSLYGALLVATEHRAFCPESAGHQSLRELARGLVHQRFWRFRWR